MEKSAKKIKFHVVAQDLFLLYSGGLVVDKATVMGGRTYESGGSAIDKAAVIWAAENLKASHYQ